MGVSRAVEAAELAMDALLGIRTTGRDESHADIDNNPYEPTPYPVLDRLVASGLVCKRNVLVDYGCGKGRVGFYLAYQTRCRTIGVERDAWLFAGAERNRAKAVSAARTRFELADAAAYVPPPEADRFYFFNPFSVAVLAPTLEGVAASLADRPRQALLMFYYPDDDYLDLLARMSWLRPAERDGAPADVDCRGLFAGDDPRERIVVYETLPGKAPWRRCGQGDVFSAT